MSCSISKKEPLIHLFDDTNENKDNYKDLNNSMGSIDNILPIEKNYDEYTLDEYTLFLCNECFQIPLLKFDVEEKIRFLCDCEREKASIEEIIGFLYKSEYKDIEELNCKDHPEEKYIYFCHTCKENICQKCAILHLGHEIEYIGHNMKIVNKTQYIKEEESENFDNMEIDIENDDEEHFPIENNIEQAYSENSNVENIISKDDENPNELKEINHSILKFEEKEKILKIISKSNPLFLYNELGKIILFHLINYPNYKLLESLSNLERFIDFFLGDYNTLILYYAFNEENIKDNKIELFGDKFVNNNNENCYLIINKNIIKLERFINLNDIFDEIPKERPILLEVQLIINSKNSLNNLSFMFYEICTITSINFNNYDNIRNMSYMFYNCELLKNLKILGLKTEKVTDMSYMFFNCSSLEQIQDTSILELGNLTKANSMFANCLSLSSIPNIKKWNLKNIKQMNYMFKNCKSLPKLPEDLNWNFDDNVETEGIFEGIESLEENISEITNEDNIILRYSKNIVNGISICFEKIFIISIKNFTLNLIGILSVLPQILPFFGFLVVQFYSIYCTFTIDGAKECINNPRNYFNSTNSTDINYNKFLYKCVDDFDREELLKDIEKCINYLLNFTRINKNTKFEQDQFYNKLYNILILVMLFSFIMIILIIFFDIRKDSINFKKDFILLILGLFFLVISITLKIMNFLVILKLTISLSDFYDNARDVYNNNSSFDSEKNVSFGEPGEEIGVFIISTLILLFFLIIIFRFLIKEKKSYNKLENRLLKINPYKNKNLFRIFISILKSSKICTFLINLFMTFLCICKKNDE